MTDEEMRRICEAHTLDPWEFPSVFAALEAEGYLRSPPNTGAFEEVAARIRIPDGLTWKYLTTVTDSDAETELLYRRCQPYASDA